MPTDGLQGQIKALGRAVGTRTGTTDVLRAVWDLRPGDRAQRRFQSWLAERDSSDNERMRLVLASTLTRTSSCVDVGANTGGFFAELVRLAPEGRHVAFEPLPSAFAQLAESFPGADLRNCAVTDVAGEIEFTEVVSSPGWSGVRASHIQTVEEPVLNTIRVRSVRLDDELVDVRPDLIKIDVNGGELGTLLGAQEVLREHRPVVLIEHGIAARGYGTTSADVWAVLHDAGLRIFDLSGDGPLSEAGFTEAALTRWNFLARS